MNTTRTATSFELRNQFNSPVGLENLADLLVLLTLLYTNYLDDCPMVTNQLRDLHVSLGKDAKDVAFVVVSVSPEQDTVQAA